MDKWEHIGNVDSMTLAEMRIEKYNKEHCEHLHKIGKPMGKYSHSWQIGLYRKIKERFKRCFLINEDYITCNNCQLNYSGSTPTKKIFCQEFSISKNPEEKEKNNKTALKCSYWIPEKIDRYNFYVDAPEHERWYEKDSMG